MWTSVDNHLVTATARPEIGNATTVPVRHLVGGYHVGNNGIGIGEGAAANVDSFGRIYAGGDGMATNGLRYGAAIEIRQNFTGQISSTGSSGASGYCLAGDAVCAARLHLCRR